MRATETVGLLVDLHDELLALLRGLTPQDWKQETVCKGWNVQDVTAHMLETQLRLISMGRDGHRGLTPPQPLESFADTVVWLNCINEEWVQAARRLSPRVLIDLLAFSGPAMNRYLEALDPEADALFPVAWAGESVSANWFDIGRSYTEYWHHQQQIRDAIAAPPLTARKWLYPVIALFMRALPRTFGNVRADGGTSLQVRVTGDAGGEWLLSKQDGWSLTQGAHPAAAATVTLSDDTTWRLFTRGLTPEAAALRVKIEGDRGLGEVFLNVVAVMA